MNRFALNCLISGAAGGLLSHIAASVCSRKERGRSELPMHAVSHIAWGDAPEAHPGRTLHNQIIGSRLHHGASVFWAAFFEALFGQRAERRTSAALAGSAAISAAAYVTDYHVVSDRFKPGFEAYLSDRSLFAVYASRGCNRLRCGGISQTAELFVPRTSPDSRRAAIRRAAGTDETSRTEQQHVRLRVR